MNYDEAGTESISYDDMSVMIRDDEMTTETGRQGVTDGCPGTRLTFDPGKSRKFKISARGQPRENFPPDVFLSDVLIKAYRENSILQIL